MTIDRLLSENIGKYAVHNGSVIDAAGFAQSGGGFAKSGGSDRNAAEAVQSGGGFALHAAEFAQSGDELHGFGGAVVYEVIRIIDGVPMFFEDHCDRLADSLRKVGADADYDRAWLSGAIGALFEANGLAGGNVKIWVAAGRHGESRDWFLNANRSFYPPASFYSSGVRAEIMAYTRDDPNVKRVVAGYREKVQSVLESRGVFELLLRDGAGYLTEGSRTNLFFVIGDKLFTAPDGMILKGIVRKQIFAAAKMAGVETVMRPICAETVMRPIGAEAAMRPAGADMPDGAASAANAANAANAGGIADLAGADAIGAVDGIFITGTSIGALPVSHVGDRPFGSAGNPVIRKLSDAYAEIAESYVSARKRA